MAVNDRCGCGDISSADLIRWRFMKSFCLMVIEADSFNQAKAQACISQ